MPGWNEKFQPGIFLCVESYQKTKPHNGLRSQRRHPDSDRRIKVLQTFALPLGYGALKNGAVDEARTRDLHLGKVALYQLSYYRL